MNLRIFRMTAKKAYDRMEDTVNRYSLEEYVTIIEYFFSRYAEKRGEDHPPIGCENIQRIMERMPYTGAPDDSIGGRDMFDYTADMYPAIIDQYFRTRFFPGCDYRIFHFMSRNVRELRLYEILFGREAAEACADGMDNIKNTKEVKAWQSRKDDADRRKKTLQRKRKNF